MKLVFSDEANQFEPILHAERTPSALEDAVVLVETLLDTFGRQRIGAHDTGLVSALRESCVGESGMPRDGLRGHACASLRSRKLVEENGVKFSDVGVIALFKQPVHPAQTEAWFAAGITVRKAFAYGNVTSGYGATDEVPHQEGNVLDA